MTHKRRNKSNSVHYVLICSINIGYTVKLVMSMLVIDPLIFTIFFHIFEMQTVINNIVDEEVNQRKILRDEMQNQQNVNKSLSDRSFLWNLTSTNNVIVLSFNFSKWSQTVIHDISEKYFRYMRQNEKKMWEKERNWKTVWKPTKM